MDIKKFLRKIIALFENFFDIFSDISPKYVISVAAAVLFTVFIIGLGLIFIDPPSIVSDQIKNSVVENSIDKKITIKIREGMTTSEIAEILAEKGIIVSTLKFRILSRLRGYDGKMQPGTYLFEIGMKESDIFRKLLTGEKHLIRVTIPEGFSVKNIAERLEELEIVDQEDFLKAAKKFAPYEYMKNSGVRYAAEGYLFPETYSIESDYSVEEILKLMTSEFNQHLTPEIISQAKKRGLTVNELVTFASILEREVQPKDRRTVAQVMYKRMEMNMPLQVDATLQYLLSSPKEDVTLSDTKIESPYNTYLNIGLPPGPISNPGMDSIEAALHPTNTDYLYFVSDRHGNNYFSYTYEEHLELVDKYR